MLADPSFAYATRRAREEIVCAINARSPGVSTAHRHLALLHAARASTMVAQAAGERLLDGLEGGTMIMSDIAAATAAPADVPAILVVDDDREIRTLLSQALAAHGYAVSVAANTAEMDEALAETAFDLVLLDIMMPGEDGVSACQRITRDGGPAVIFLSGLGEERDRIVGLEAGAGHYLPKPCSAREVVSTVRAALRARHLAEPAERRRFLFDGWQMDVGVHELLDPSGVLVGLTDGEFALLRAFVERPRRILSRDALLEAARGPNSESFDRAIDVQISRLRRKLRAPGDEIVRTIRNEGYLFVPNVVRA